MALKPLVRVSGGNPAGCPDFRPINAHGHMPKRQAPPDRSLWVCNVEDRATRCRVDVGVVGPRDGAQMLADAIRQMIEAGKEHRWGDPQVVRVLT